MSRIFLENTTSRAAGASLQEVGIYEQHVQSYGVWRDVVIVERLLPGSIANPPTW